MPFLSGNGSMFHILLRNMNVKKKKSERAYVGAAAYAFYEQLICQACTSECKVIKTVFESQFKVSVFVKHCEFLCVYVNIFFLLSTSFSMCHSIAFKFI